MEKDNDIKKILTIGLDGATFDLIKPWIEKGKLPTIRKLMKEGTYGNLKSIFPPLSCPAWKSFSTGKNPGKLGAFGFVVLEPDTYKPYPVNADYFTNYELWDLLGQKGLKSGVVNMPLTYPPKEINGFMVSGYFTPNLKHDFTWPKELKREILRIFDYKIKPESRGRYDKNININEDIQEHHALVDILTKTTKHLMREKEWNYFLVVFREIDFIQHFMWKYMDKNSPEWTLQNHKKYGHIIETYWKKIDTAIEQIIEEVDEDTSIIIMSDHGFGRVNKNFNVNDWLIEKGFLKLKDKGKFAFLDKVGISNQNARDILKRLRALELLVKKLVPRRYLVKIINKLPLKGGIVSLENANIDWKKTKAFNIGEVTIGTIYINTKQRPDGIVEQEYQYEKLRDEIIKELKNIIDPDTNRPLKIDVYKPEDIYSGELIKLAPDILFQIEDLNIGIEPTVGHKSLFVSPSSSESEKFSGIHRINGLFIAKGKDIQIGNEIKKAEIIDLAPTILHMMNVPIPKDMDGKVLKEIFNKDSEIYRKRIEYQEVEAKKDRKTFEISEDVKEEIKKKLKSLGYM